MTLLFLVIVSLSLGDTSKFFRVGPPLKCTCTPYFLQMVLKLLQMPCEYGTTIWHLLSVSWADGICLLLFVFWWSCCFWGTLFIASLGYLHCIRTFSRCCKSLVSSCWVEHMVLALCVRVLITLYLDARLWWLSHWRYKSVWVGFLYKPVVKVPSVWGVIKISRNGMEPSGLASSTVNWMEGSSVLCVRRIPPCMTGVGSQKCHQHTSSRSLRGSIQLWWLCVQNPAYKCWLW